MVSSISAKKSSSSLAPCIAIAIALSSSFNPIAMLFRSHSFSFWECLIALKLLELCVCECDLPKLIRYLNDLTMLFKMLFEMCSNVVWHGLPRRLKSVALVFRRNSHSHVLRALLTHSHIPNGKKNSDFLLTLIRTSKWRWWRRWWWSSDENISFFARTSTHMSRTHLHYTFQELFG